MLVIAWVITLLMLALGGHLTFGWLFGMDTVTVVDLLGPVILLVGVALVRRLPAVIA